jgi:hypothetical protein
VRYLAPLQPGVATGVLVAACAFLSGCFDPARVVEFKLYPSPIMGHVSLDQDVSAFESHSLDPDVVRAVLPKARRMLLPETCKGCWLATMKLDDGREYRVRLDRFRYWFHVEGDGYFRFFGAAKDEFREATAGGAEWIHQNSHRWNKDGVASDLTKQQGHGN